MNERIARANAFITSVLVIAFIATQYKIILVFLAMDFIIRGFLKVRYSPIKKVSEWIIDLLNPSKKLINAGPKKFAAKIGFVLSFTILALLLFKIFTLALIVAGILLFFSVLEAVFGICVACKIYPYIYPKVTIKT